MNECVKSKLTLASRFVHGFLDGGKQVFENGAAAEIDFGGNLHARMRESIN